MWHVINSFSKQQALVLLFEATDVQRLVVWCFLFFYQILRRPQQCLVRPSLEEQGGASVIVRLSCCERRWPWPWDPLVRLLAVQSVPPGVTHRVTFIICHGGSEDSWRLSV